MRGEKYGGTYLKPQIYIAEADHKGWLQFSRIVVPNPTGCDPKNSNFLMLDSIVKDIDKNKQKIQNHELNASKLIIWVKTTIFDITMMFRIFEFVCSTRFTNEKVDLSIFRS